MYYHVVCPRVGVLRCLLSLLLFTIGKKIHNIHLLYSTKAVNSNGVIKLNKGFR